MNRFGLQLITALTFLFTSFTATAQSDFLQGNTFNYDNQLVSGFSEDGRVKVLLLTLLPYDLTETAAEKIGRALQLNLFNTNHFTVVGPSEWNAQIQERDPTLADCHDIACGVLIGKLFNADKVLVGSVRAETILDENGNEVQGLVLSAKIVDVLTIGTDYDDEVRFTDARLHDSLFQMALRISHNTQLHGYVLKLNASTITVDLGRAHGLKVGNRLVVFRPTTATSTLEGQPLELNFENIAIAEAIRVNDMSSEIHLIQRRSSVLVGDQIRTYVNKNKQIALIAQTRKELDTQKRLAPRTKPLKLVPQLVQEDTGENRWARKYAAAQENEEFWMIATIGTIGGALLSASGIIKIGSGIDQYLPWILGGGAIYSGYRYVEGRDTVDALRAEGRSSGFLSWKWSPTSGATLAYTLSF
ncbi:MAG: hypothetical protein CL923_02350 [Deltaproteobacteria bacterium]|jgi:hypothetical protein|nr:hypothetical protein [Deltaproteobacteria bacterium]MDP7158887.1 hypothetical protein [SAR324 cluster bacterium]